MKKIVMFLVLALTLTALPLAAVEVRDEGAMSLYRIHLGMGVGEEALTATEIQKFIDQEITPRFSNGLTILEGRGQWAAPEGLIKERTTVVDVQGPGTEEVQAKVAEIAEIYVERYQDARASVYVMRVDNTHNILYYQY